MHRKRDQCRPTLGIPRVTDWPKFVKWLLNASAISPGEVKISFPILIWDNLVDFFVDTEAL